ncbi:MAG: ShlB/FhaC/HecB family hemolysin secretion/activation protein [Pseudomonadales bacterium]
MRFVTAGGRCRRMIAAASLLIAVLAAPAVDAAPFAALMFDDGSEFTPEDLLPVYRHDLGGPLNAALAGRVARELAAHYQTQGYLPPAPKLLRLHEAAGVLVMEMREARVSRVQLDGRENVDDARFWTLVSELRSMQPLSQSGFDAWLERARSLGLAIRGSLIRESAQPHEYVASLQVDPRRWGGFVHVDNRGPEQLGHEIAQVSLNYRFDREALGQYRLDVAAAVDHERLRYVGVSGRHRTSARGDRLLWRYAQSESTLPVINTTRTVDYERKRAEIGYAVPLARRTRQHADLHFGLRSYDLDQYLDDGRPLRRDRIRALQVGYDLIVATEIGSRHSFNALLSRGIEGLGASLWPDGAEADFAVWTLDYGYRRRLDDAWQLWGGLSTQISGSRLPTSERFFIGGREFGGAFDPATLSGDEGAGARVGLERLLELSFFDQPLTAFAYYDHGWVWSNDAAGSRDDAGSAGLGVRGRLAELSWTLELGLPVLSPETATLLNDETRLFFSLTQRF